MFMGFLFPIVALVTGQPWVNVVLPEFILRSFVLSLAGIIVMRFIKRSGWLRPADAPIASWEMVFFQFIRWPWILYACLQATLGVLLKKEFTFKVTPKGWKGAKPLPFVAVLPYVIIMLVEAGTAILISNPEKAGGYYYFCIVYSITYVVVLAVIIFLHVKENWSKLDIPVVKYVGKPMVYTIVMAVYVMFAFTLRADIVFKTIIPNIGPYHSYTMSDISKSIMSTVYDGQIKVSTIVDHISDYLSVGVLLYAIIVVGAICLIGILVRLTLGMYSRRLKELFPPS
jgi:hypothetical protein